MCKKGGIDARATGLTSSSIPLCSLVVEGLVAVFLLQNSTQNWSIKFPLEVSSLFYTNPESIAIRHTLLSRSHPHILATGGSILTFPCSQTASTSPSLSLRNVPLITHILFPALTTSLSTSTFSPSGTGFRYVTLSPLVTPAYCQYPGLAIGARAVVVQMSNIVAVHPPCRFPRRLQCEGSTVKRNYTISNTFLLGAGKRAGSEP